MAHRNRAAVATHVTNPKARRPARKREATSGAPETPSLPHLDIEEARRILPQLFDALTEAVVVIDRNHRVVAANRRFAEAFGCQTPDVVGALCHQTIACPGVGPGGPESCETCDVFQVRQPRHALRSIPDASGVMRRWETTLSPVLDHNGEITHVVEVWRDITDRSHLESQLSHSERLASLGMLAAGVGHEINNPLAGILTGVETLQRWMGRATCLDPVSRADISEVLQLVERETLRTREITEKLLMLAQPYQGAPDWTDVNRAVRDTLSLLGYQMREQGIMPVEELDSGLPAIWAKGSGIRGVLMNLCMNAVQAMPRGGTLTVRTRARSPHIIIDVEDTGPGIPAAHRDHIWDPFFTTKPVGQGTGLGLSITQRIVTKHGGTIRVDSSAARGARFVIELPIGGPGGEHV